MKTTDDEIILIDTNAHTGGEYPIGFDTCDTAEKILSHVDNLCKKNWVTVKQIQYLILHATSKHNIQIHD